MCRNWPKFALKQIEGHKRVLNRTSNKSSSLWLYLWSLNSGGVGRGNFHANGGDRDAYYLSGIHFPIFTIMVVLWLKYLFLSQGDTVFSSVNTGPRINTGFK